MAPLMRPCHLCGKSEAVPTERYCIRCRGTMINRMIRDGYLKPVKFRRKKFRPLDAKESRSTDTPGSWYNLIRALECA